MTVLFIVQFNLGFTISSANYLFSLILLLLAKLLHPLLVKPASIFNITKKSLRNKKPFLSLKMVYGIANDGLGLTSEVATTKVITWLCQIKKPRCY